MDGRPSELILIFVGVTVRGQNPAYRSTRCCSYRFILGCDGSITQCQLSQAPRHGRSTNASDGTYRSTRSCAWAECITREPGAPISQEPQGAPRWWEPQGLPSSYVAHPRVAGLNRSSDRRLVANSRNSRSTRDFRSRGRHFRQGSRIAWLGRLRGKRLACVHRQ